MTTEIQIVNPRVHEDELAKMRGDSDKTLKLWTKPHMSHLNAYRSHSIGGQGQVLAIPKEENPELVAAFDSGRETWIEVKRKGKEYTFHAFHLTQEFLDAELDQARRDFAEVISKPYTPRAPYKPGGGFRAWLRTIGDLPFETGMEFRLVPEPREYYVQNLGHPVVFVCDNLQQPIHLTQGKAANEKIIRAVLSGYEVTAVAELVSSNRSLIPHEGALMHHHNTEAVFSFTLKEQKPT